MDFAEVWKPKNLPPSRRMSCLEQSGLAHFEIIFRRVELSVLLDVGEGQRVALNRKLEVLAVITQD